MPTAGRAQPGVRWHWLAMMLLAATAVLVFHRQTYWRPFDDTAEESTVSSHAFGFAAASTADLWPNPIVARHVDLEHGAVQPYPHWPNGFFLLLEGALVLFGRTETVGRSFAIGATLLGFVLVVASLRGGGPLLYAVIPLALLSGDGRDSIPFVFNDAAIYFSAGALLWASRYCAGHPGYNLIFRALLVAVLLLNQLVFPYALAIVLVQRLEGRRTREVLLDLAVLASAGGWILLAIAAGGGELGAGLGELQRIFRYNYQPLAESWPMLLARYWRESLNLGAAGVVLVPAAWVVSLVARQWRVAVLLPAYGLFAFLLPQYATVHHFPRLQLVFFSLVTLAAGIEIALGRAPLLRDRPAIAAMAGLAVAAVAGARLAATNQQYRVDPHLRDTRASLMRIVENPAHAAQLERCNAFAFRFPAGHHFPYEYNPSVRIGQFYFGRQVAERARRGDPLRRCIVDLNDRTLRGPVEH